MQAVIDNPFAVLTAVVAPAILTNACSVLALGIGNRVARVVDRARAMMADLAVAEKETAPYTNLLVQVRRLQTRSRLLLGALRLAYAALGGFAASATLCVVGAIAAYYRYSLAVATSLALLTGLFAVSALVASCIMLVTEARLALLFVHQALEDAIAARSEAAS